MFKSRQTPINSNTLKNVPRIELNAAKLAASLRLVISDELRIKFHEIYYWFDSLTVLRYIRNDTASLSAFCR